MWKGLEKRGPERRARLLLCPPHLLYLRKLPRKSLAVTLCSSSLLSAQIGQTPRPFFFSFSRLLTSENPAEVILETFL